MGIEDARKDGDKSLALEASYRSTRIIENMLASDLIQYGQIHL